MDGCLVFDEFMLLAEDFDEDIDNLVENIL